MFSKYANAVNYGIFIKNKSYKIYFNLLNISAITTKKILEIFISFNLF